MTGEGQVDRHESTVPYEYPKVHRKFKVSHGKVRRSPEFTIREIRTTGRVIWRTRTSVSELV